MNQLFLEKDTYEDCLRFSVGEALRAFRGEGQEMSSESLFKGTVLDFDSLNTGGGGTRTCAERVFQVVDYLDYFTGRLNIPPVVREVI